MKTFMIENKKSEKVQNIPNQRTGTLIVMTECTKQTYRDVTYHKIINILNNYRDAIYPYRIYKTNITYHIR